MNSSPIYVTSVPRGSRRSWRNKRLAGVLGGLALLLVVGTKLGQGSFFASEQHTDQARPALSAAGTDERLLPEVISSQIQRQRPRVAPAPAGGTAAIIADQIPVRATLVSSTGQRIALPPAVQSGIPLAAERVASVER